MNDDFDTQQKFEQIEKVRSGQKLIMYAILLNIACFLLALASANMPVLQTFGQVCLLIALVMGIMGIIKMSSGLGFGVGLVVLFCILMFLPLVSLILLVVLNSKATKALRANGYTVGLLGANPKY